ncbi:MAG TPA: outer membrane beta-barrel protein [Candidatus Didemnitutus sp.]|nr:outer membrane beta-barrel protein [Candidatus Didemnitutus sp.]
MTTRSSKQLLCIAALAWLLGQQGVFGLLSFDGTRNQVFVFGNVIFGYDSNIFSDNSGRDDFNITGRAGMEYKRRAGIIAVDFNAHVDSIRFQDFSGQDAVNPNFSLQLEKTTGRTTGAFNISAYRSSQADAAVNIRTNSWNYPMTLLLKYPVNERYYLTSDTGYNAHHYIDNDQLLDYREWSEDVNLFYIYTSKLDLSVGYRLRYGETSEGRTIDNNFTVGATGGLLPKLNGSVRFGYQVRNDDVTHQSYDSGSALVQLTWTSTRKFTMDLLLSSDFNTAATGVTVDTISATVTGNYTFTRRFQGDVSVGFGRNHYVSEPPPQREDTYTTFNIGAIYTVNEHLKFTAGYTYFKNSSTLATADYDRDVLTLDISSRF